MKSTVQPDLFGDTEPSPSPSPSPSPTSATLAPAPLEAAQAVIRINAPAATLSKAQREFNRLIEGIERLRGDLTQWHAARERARARQAAEVAPLHDRLHTLQRDAVLWIDGFLARPVPRGEPRLPKKLRLKLTWMLLHLARVVLAEGPDAEVEAAHDRQAAQSYREDQREQADLAAAVLGSAVGDERLFEGPADSVEELLARATQRMRDDADVPESDPPAQAADGAAARPSRADKALQRDAQALKEASQSVREVYRRLASSLHPDRESDPAERARKTALMAKVNEAYERNDLLELLTVQMAIEQIDAEHLRGVSDQRLRHYIRVLKEQEQSLRAELEWARMPLLQHLGGVVRPGRLLPQAYDRMIEEQLQQLRVACRQLDTDCALLRDEGTRRPFLTALEIDDPDEELDPFEALLLEQALSEMMMPAAPAKRAGGRRGGRR